MKVDYLYQWPDILVVIVWRKFTVESAVTLRKQQWVDGQAPFDYPKMTQTPLAGEKFDNN